MTRTGVTTGEVDKDQGQIITVGLTGNYAHGLKGSGLSCITQVKPIQDEAITTPRARSQSRKQKVFPIPT